MEELYVEDFFQPQLSKKEMEKLPLNTLEELPLKKEEGSSLSCFKELKKAIEEETLVKEMLSPYLSDIERALECGNREGILALTDEIEELLDARLLTEMGC